MGINFGRYKPDEPLRHIETNAVQSSVEAFSGADPDKVWTIRDLAEWIGIGGLGPLFVGGPQTVADLLEEWVVDTDVDGFNLAYAVTHETFSDIVTHLVPELQKQGGCYKHDYTAGTLREKFLAEGTLAEGACRRAVPQPRKLAARARRRGMRDKRND